MGKNKDVYVVHEKASDTYCGRILQGLPVSKMKWTTVVQFMYKKRVGNNE